MDPNEPLPRSGWLIRIPAVFDDLADDLVKRLGDQAATRLGKEFHLIRPADPAAMRASPAFRFVAWNLPVHHAWPCCPQKMDRFVEKAAQAVALRFAPLQAQAVLVGPIHSGAAHPYYKRLASNLRGRILQLLPGFTASPAPELQDPLQPSLFCLVGKEGLFCGLQSPRHANGFFPGGTRFIRQNHPATISRAGAKLAEALHFLPLYQPPPPAGSRWLELGASPGGMTAELLDRGFHVTAIDRAPLDSRLARRPGLTSVRAEVATWHPPTGARFAAILCDLNGDARRSIRQVARLALHLPPGGTLIFTLKLAYAETLAAIDALHAEVTETALQAGLRLFAQTHLTYNRREFTLFFTTA